MKVKTKLSRIWCSIVGALFSLAGVAQTDAAIGPAERQGDAGLEPKNRAARPETERLKAHKIAFDDASGAKNRGAVAQEPDGRFRGVIAQSDGRSKGVIEEPAAKDKATILPPPTPSAKERELHQAPPAPQDKAFVFDSTQPKDKAIIITPGQEREHFIPPPPPKEGIIGHDSPGQDKGHFIPPPSPKDTAFQMSEPGKKDKAIWMADPSGTDKGLMIVPAPPEKGRAVPPPPQQQPGPPLKDHKCDHFAFPPARDEAIDEQLINPPAPQAPAPAPQSLRPGIDYSLLLTQEQKDHVVMGIRDRLWTLNAEGKLERRLAGGVRAVCGRADGWRSIAPRGISCRPIRTSAPSGSIGPRGLPSE